VRERKRRKFWSSFVCTSISRASFGVMPLSPRSIPSREFEKIELPRIGTAVADFTRTPLPDTIDGPLNAITFPAP
jgi:hypothetical protein